MTIPDGARDLPITAVLDDVLAVLADRTRVILQAPPGAGKTTVVPLALLHEDWCSGRIVMLEPRRLAVRNAVRRMADLLGERPGGRVGWRMRDDTKVSARTRIEVVTEAVLTRMLQTDPTLEGVSAVVFDEFHERSIDADLGLTLTLDSSALRDDLRIVVMSATLDTGPLAAVLDAPVIRSDGRAHAVDIIHVDVDRRARPDLVVAPAVRRALAEQVGDILVFLPGAAEIDRVAGALRDIGNDVDVRPLHGRLPHEAQDLAIAPSLPGRRKVVLATSIAETSITIEGVTVVVDAGWRRTPRLDHATGMSRLVTLPVTRAEADQRAGRAGRTQPGVAYRLWGAAVDRHLASHPEPEIDVADLAPLALEVLTWGASVDDLTWVTAPPPRHLAAAASVLERIGAVDHEGALTRHGRAIARVPLHPRLAHLLIRGVEQGYGARSADVAAFLASDQRGGRDTDVEARLRGRLDPSTRRLSERLQRIAASVSQGRSSGEGSRAASGAVGALAALAFPDRIGRRRTGQRGEFLLANGRGAFVDLGDPLADVEFLVALDVDARGPRARIRAAAALHPDDVDRVAGDAIETHQAVHWDHGRLDVVATETERLGAITLVERPLAKPDATLVRTALLEGVRTEGLGLLGWSRSDTSLQDRLGFLHEVEPDRWPAADNAALLAALDDRLGPHLSGCRRARDLARVSVSEVLLHGLDWERRRAIDRLAPERLRVASGHEHRVDYAGATPVLAVKLQELFGSTTTPTVFDGRVPVVLHLLSPAGRPLQITQDLAGFWAGAYRDVRAEMRGRYPKHPWPEDPLTATPTARTTRRR